MLIIEIYVDDILFYTTIEVICQELYESISREFEISIMGKLDLFLRLQMNQGWYVHQRVIEKKYHIDKDKESIQKSKFSYRAKDFWIFSRDIEVRSLLPN